MGKKTPHLYVLMYSHTQLNIMHYVLRRELFTTGLKQAFFFYVFYTDLVSN